MKLIRTALMAFAASAFVSTSAFAADLTLTNLAFSGASTVDVNGQEVYLGQAYFTANVGGKIETIGAYCVDLTHEITVGALNLPYNFFTLTTNSDGLKSGTGTLLGTTVADEIGGLAEYGLHSSDAITKDAVQALIWEDLGATLSGFGDNGAAIQNEIATLKTLNLTSSIAPTTIYAVDGSTQGFTTGVPEPATWAVMLMGFGGLGVAMRSRRRQASQTA